MLEITRDYGTVFEDGAEAYATLTIKKAPSVATSIDVTGPSSITLPGTKEPDNTATYTAKVFDQYGEEMDASGITWSVSPADKGVSVTNGVVTVTKDAAVGDYTITASNGKISGSTTISVAKAASVPASVTISGADSVGVPDTVEYTAVVKDQYGVQINNPTVEWSITSADGVSLEGNKVIVGADAVSGTVTVTAKAGSAQATKALTITRAPVDNVTLALTAPVKGETLGSSVTADKGTAAVTWYEGNTASGTAVSGTAKGDTVYTAKIVVTPDAKDTFAQTVTVTLNGETVTATKDGKNLVITKTFDKTSAKDPLTGEVTISGEVTIGKTLTAQTSLDKVTYQWYSDGQPINGATDKTYTLTKNEAGKKITVKVTATADSEYAGFIESDPTGEVAKKDQAAPTMPAVTATESTITVGQTANTAWEYSLDGNIWQDSNTFTGLNPENKYTVYVRAGETDECKASAPVQKEVTTAKAKEEVKITATDLDKTYDGQPFDTTKVTFTQKGTGKAAYTFYDKDKNALASAPSDAGKYFVKVSVAASAGYEAGESELVAFEIKTKEVEVVWTNTTLPYNGTEQAPVASAKDGEISVAVTVSGQQTDVGTYTATAATTNTNYTLTNATTKYTIAPKEVAVEWSNTELTYNGTAQGPTAEVKGDLVAGDTLPVTVGGKQTNAGTNYEATATTTNTNYKLTNATTKYTIAPKAVSVDWTNTTLTYNGTAQAPAAAAKDGEISVAVTVSGQQTDVGTYTATAATNNGNYTLTDATKTTQFAIVKADWTATAVTASAKYGTAAEVDLTNYIAAEGKTGTITVDTENALENVAVSNGKLTFSVKNDETLVGKTVKITIPVTDAKNYNDYSIVVTLTISDKLPQTNFKFPAATQTKTYGDADFTVAATGAVSGSTVTYTSSDPTVATVDANGKVHILKAGTATITASASAAGDYDAASDSYVLTIDKKAITITAKDQTIKVGDTVPALGTNSYTVTGLVGNEKLTKEPKVEYVGTPDNTKEGTYAIKVSGAEASANFTITYFNGKLTITKEEQNTPVPNPPAHDCAIIKFNDCDPNQWYHEGIDYAVNNGLMNGVGTGKFAPNANTTRAMIVTILWRLEGEPAGADAGFADVADGQWYSEAIDWAAENGVVTGYSATKFGPMDSITREQMAAILYRYADLKGYDVSDSKALSFADAGSVSGYAVDAMQWAVAEGLINGVGDNTLNPKGTATRAQVATILMRFCENVAK